jgi:hypothetical protein
LSKDVWQGDYTRPQSLNAWGYTEGNPINRVDPSGQFSVQQIMQSYGVDDPGGLISLFSSGQFKGRWGWLKLLLDAQEGEVVWAGAPVTFPPYLDETNHETLRVENEQIYVGGQSLLGFTSNVLNLPIGSGYSIWWRDTTPHFYYLQDKQYVDADRAHDLPDFRFIEAAVSGAVFRPGVSGIVDRYGHLYLSVSLVGLTAGGTIPVSVGEGYVAHSLGEIGNQISGRGSIPSPAQIQNTIVGFCDNFSGTAGAPNVTAVVCASSTFAFVYGYSLGMAGSAYVTLGIDLNRESGDLAWDYIDHISGTSMQEVLPLILPYAYLPCLSKQ